MASGELGKGTMGGWRAAPLSELIGKAGQPGFGEGSWEVGWLSGVLREGCRRLANWQVRSSLGMLAGGGRVTMKVGRVGSPSPLGLIERLVGVRGNGKLAVRVH